MAKRPRSRRQRTRPDAPGAEAASDGGIGHNSGGPEPLNEDERRALFVHHIGKLTEAKAELKEAAAVVKMAKKQIKSDGFTVRQVEAGIALGSPEGEERVRQEVEERLQAARWLGRALAASTALPEGQSADAAFEEGKVAGMAGRDRKPPYSFDHPGYEAWMNGYYQGQEVLQARVGRGPEAVVS